MSEFSLFLEYAKKSTWILLHIFGKFSFIFLFKIPFYKFILVLNFNSRSKVKV